MQFHLLKEREINNYRFLTFLATSCYHYLLLHAELKMVIFMKNQPFLKSAEFSVQIAIFQTILSRLRFSLVETVALGLRMGSVGCIE
jgi:hypothetical protein